MRTVILFDEEIELILWLVKNKVASGDSIRMVNAYLRLYEKISGEKIV